MLVHFRDGTKATGRIRDVHEDDFDLAQGGENPDRRIAYTELANAPEQITPLAEEIAKYAGLGIMFVICFPFILIMGLAGVKD